MVVSRFVLVLVVKTHEAFVDLVFWHLAVLKRHDLVLHYDMDLSNSSRMKEARRFGEAFSDRTCGNDLAELFVLNITILPNLPIGRKSLPIKNMR